MSKGSVTNPSGVINAGRRFVKEEKGNVAIIGAVMMLPLMFAGGIAVDYTHMEQRKAKLQHTSDSAALFAVQEIRRIGFDRADLFDQAQNALSANFRTSGETVALEVDHASQTLSVTLETDYKPAFLKMMGYDSMDIKVATEVEYGTTFGDPRCIMSLSREGHGVVSLNGNASIQAQNCAVHVNSSSFSALDLNGSGTEIRAAEVCVVGDVDSGFNRIYPTPQTGCDPIDDPFDEYALPSVGGCDFTDIKVKGQGSEAARLQPGTYCGGIDIAANAQVIFEPGLYTIKDGVFKTTGSAQLSGEGVTFFFTGRDVALEFSGGTDFRFTAMDTGELANFIVYFDPSAEAKGTSSFSGNSETSFEGILYFGENDVEINGEGEVNLDSGLSVIVADTIILNGNGTLHMNVDPTRTSLGITNDIYERELTMHISK